MVWGRKVGRNEVSLFVILLLRSQAYSVASQAEKKNEEAPRHNEMVIVNTPVALEPGEHRFAR